jgi:hypothetical protein
MSKNIDKGHVPITTAKFLNVDGHGGNGHGDNGDDNNNLYNYSALISRIDKLELSVDKSINKHTDDINDLKQDLKDVKQEIKGLYKWFIGLGFSIILSLVAIMGTFIGIIIALFMLQQNSLNKLLDTKSEIVDLQIKQFDDKLAAQIEANEWNYQLELEDLKKSTEPPTR